MFKTSDFDRGTGGWRSQHRAHRDDFGYDPRPRLGRPSPGASLSPRNRDRTRRPRQASSAGTSPRYTTARRGPESCPA